jgi:hypothetical protein
MDNSFPQGENSAQGRRYWLKIVRPNPVDKQKLGRRRKGSKSNSPLHLLAARLLLLQ